MISVHPRVDRFLKHILPEWSIIDFGCGDQYLASKHPDCINVDRVNNSGVEHCCDLDWEYPNATGDCAIISGLLEWLIYPSQFLKWALTQYPHVYFSYANSKTDPNWMYATTIDNIVYDLKKLGCSYKTEIWEGQTLFFVDRN